MTTSSFALTGAVGRLRRPRLRVPLQHLFLQNAPYLAVERMEFLVEPGLENVARPRQADLPIADDARVRARRHDDDAVGERDRLLEVMGDEQHRLAVRVPEIEQQVSHDLPRL